MFKDKMNLLTALVVVLFLGLGVGILFWGNSRKESMERTLYSVEDKIAELEKKLAELDEPVETVEEVYVKLNSAADAGTKVAKMQTKYATIDILADAEGLRDNADSIGMYLVDKSRQVPWFDVKSGIVGSQWTFCTTYSFAGDSVDVLWECRETTGAGRLLAYTTGTYYVSQGMFDDINVAYTSIGAAYMNGQYSPGESTGNGEPVDDGQDGAQAVAMPAGATYRIDNGGDYPETAKAFPDFPDKQYHVETEGDYTWVDMAEDMYMGMPEYVRQVLEDNGFRIVISNTPLREKYGDDRILAAVTDYNAKVIYLDNRDEALVNMYHEVGHVVDRLCGYVSSMEEFKELYKSEIGGFFEMNHVPTSGMSALDDGYVEYFACLFFNVMRSGQEFSHTASDSYAFMNRFLNGEITVEQAADEPVDVQGNDSGINDTIMSDAADILNNATGGGSND